MTLVLFSFADRLGNLFRLFLSLLTGPAFWAPKYLLVTHSKRRSLHARDHASGCRLGPADFT